MDESLDEVCDRLLGPAGWGGGGGTESFIEDEIRAEQDACKELRRDGGEEAVVGVVGLDVTDSCTSVLEDLSRVRSKMKMLRSSSSTSSAPRIPLSVCRGAEPPRHHQRDRTVSDGFAANLFMSSGPGLPGWNSLTGDLSDVNRSSSAVDLTPARGLLQYSVQYNPHIRVLAHRERMFVASQQHGPSAAVAQQGEVSPPAALNLQSDNLNDATLDSKENDQRLAAAAAGEKRLSDELLKQRELLEGIAKQQHDQHQIQLVMQQKFKEDERRQRDLEQHQSRAPDCQNSGRQNKQQSDQRRCEVVSSVPQQQRQTIVAPVLSLDSFDLQQRRDAAAVEKALQKERALMDAERKAWQGMLKAQNEEHQRRLDSEKRLSQQSTAEQRQLMHDTAKQVYENMSLEQRMVKEAQGFQVEQQKRQMTAIRELLRPVASSVVDHRGGATPSDSGHHMIQSPYHSKTKQGSSKKTRGTGEPESPLAKGPGPSDDLEKVGNHSPYAKELKRRASRTVDSATASSPLAPRHDAILQAAPAEDPAVFDAARREFEFQSTDILDSNHNKNSEAFELGTLRPVLVLTDSLSTETSGQHAIDDADCNFCVEMCVATFGKTKLSEKDAVDGTARKKVLDKLTQEEAAMLRDARRRLERIRTFSLTQPRDSEHDFDCGGCGVIHSIVGEAAEQLLFGALSAGLVHEVIAEEVRQNASRGETRIQPVISLVPPGAAPCPEVDAIASQLVEECLVEYANVHPLLERTRRPPAPRQVEESTRTAVVDEILKSLLAPPSSRAAKKAESANDDDDQQRRNHQVLEPIPHEVVRRVVPDALMSDSVLAAPAAGSATEPPCPATTERKNNSELVVSAGHESGSVQMQNCTIRVVLDWGNIWPSISGLHANATSSNAMMTLQPSLAPTLLTAEAQTTVEDLPPVLATSATSPLVPAAIEPQTSERAGPGPDPARSGLNEEELIRRIAAMVTLQLGATALPGSSGRVDSRERGPTQDVDQSHDVVGMPDRQGLSGQQQIILLAKTGEMLSKLVDSESAARTSLENEATQMFSMLHETSLYPRSGIRQLQQQARPAGASSQLDKDKTQDKQRSSDEQLAPPSKPKISPEVPASAGMLVTGSETKPAVLGASGTQQPDATPPAQNQSAEPIRDRVTSFIVEWFKVLDDADARKRTSDYAQINQSLQQMVATGRTAAGEKQDGLAKPKTREEIVRRALDDGHESTLDYSTTHASSYMPDGRHRFAEPHARRRRADTTNTTETTVYFNDSRTTGSANTTTSDSTRTSSGTSTTVSSMDSSELDLVLKQHMLQWPTGGSVPHGPLPVEQPRQASAGTDVRAA